MWNFILKFLVPIAVDLAIRFGFPSLVNWLSKVFPFIPKDVFERLLVLVKEAIAKISGVEPVAARKVIAKEVRRQARKDAKNCIGSICKMDTK